MARTPHQQLTAFLSDMYSVEEQALVQMDKAPDLAEDPGLAEDFRVHHGETRQQADLVRERLEEAGGKPSAVKDAIMKLGGKSFLLFAQAQPETPGRLLTHAYSYEAMEAAGYAMLAGFADAAGDARTAEVARNIEGQERTMMRRLEGRFDAADAASHRDTPADKMADHVRKHLREAHAIETQTSQLLARSESLLDAGPLANLCRQNLAQTEQHIGALEARLRALGDSASKIKDAALGLGGLQWSVFFQAQSDTPAKLVAFLYAVEHLEIAGYELLKRAAHRAGDVDTERLCDRTLAEERSAAQKLADHFNTAVQSTLEKVQA